MADLSDRPQKPGFCVNLPGGTPRYFLETGFFCLYAKIADLSDNSISNLPSTIWNFNAEPGTWTPKALLPLEPESSASTNSASSAGLFNFVTDLLLWRKSSDLSTGGEWDFWQPGCRGGFYQPICGTRTYAKFLYVGCSLRAESGTI